MAGDSRPAQQIAEVGRIGRIEAARLVLRDLAGAEHLDGDGAGLALGVGEVQQRHLDPARRRRPELAADDDRHLTIDAIEQRDRERGALDVPVGDVRALDLVDDEAVRHAQRERRRRRRAGRRW